MGNGRKRRSQKAGMAPGALVHIGEVKTDQTALVLTSIGSDGVIEQAITNPGEAKRGDPAHPLRWLNIYGVHDAAMMAAVGREFGLHPLVIEDILNTDQRPKVDAFDTYLYVVGKIYDPARTRGDLAMDQISLVIGQDFVLSFQERRSGTFDPIRQRLRGEKAGLRQISSDYLAYTLLDAMIDGYFSVIERLGDKCELLEEEILGGPKRNALQQVHALKREVSTLRRILWPTREMIGSLQRNHPDRFSESTRIYLRDIYDHSVHLLEQLEDLRELLSGLLDIYLSSVSNRVNLEVRTLTLLTTVFMPAALVAGIFGMNFRHMPLVNETDGFWTVLSLMTAIAAALFGVFWSRRLFR